MVAVDLRMTDFGVNVREVVDGLRTVMVRAGLDELEVVVVATDRAVDFWVAHLVRDVVGVLVNEALAVGWWLRVGHGPYCAPGAFALSLTVGEGAERARKRTRVVFVPTASG